MDLTTIRQVCHILDENIIVGFNSREVIVYPLLDTLFAYGARLDVELDVGLRLSYAYKTNIAKEILLREREFPSHAWEPMTTRVVELALSFHQELRGSVLIGGAYFGDHALVAANTIKSLGVTGNVICVEPDPESHGLLLENAEQNDLSDVLGVETGVLWSAPGLKFTLDDEDSHASVSLNTSGNLESQTIDQILADRSINDVALILLDIEGSEAQALDGASQTLSAPPSKAPVVVVEIHRNYVDWSYGLNGTPIVKLLRQHDYEVYALRDVQGNWELDLDKIEIVTLESVVLDGPPHGFNLIAAKDNNFFNDEHFLVVSNVSPKYLRHQDPALHAPLQVTRG